MRDKFINKKMLLPQKSFSLQKDPSFPRMRESSRKNFCFKNRFFDWIPGLARYDDSFINVALKSAIKNVDEKMKRKTKDNIIEIFSGMAWNG